MTMLTFIEPADLTRVVAGRASMLGRWGVGIGAIGCQVCSTAEHCFGCVLSHADFESTVDLYWINIGQVEDLKRMKLNIKEFPTILVFRGDSIISAWSGFVSAECDEGARTACELFLRQELFSESPSQV